MCCYCNIIIVTIDISLFFILLYHHFILSSIFSYFVVTAITSNVDAHSLLSNGDSSLIYMDP